MKIKVNARLLATLGRICDTHRFWVERIRISPTKNGAYLTATDGKLVMRVWIKGLVLKQAASVPIVGKVIASFLGRPNPSLDVDVRFTTTAATVRMGNRSLHGGATIPPSGSYPNIDAAALDRMGDSYHAVTVDPVLLQRACESLRQLAPGEAVTLYVCSDPAKMVLLQAHDWEVPHVVTLMPMLSRVRERPRWLKDGEEPNTEGRG